MALTLIEQVRLKSSDKSELTREETIGDAITDTFKLAHQNVLTSPAPRIWNGTTLLTETTDYEINYTQGIVTFTSPPAVNDTLTFEYYWAIFSDEEVQQFLDDAGSNVSVAAAFLLMALAADAAKVAKREALTGGGGLGAITRDTAVRARELREAAKALIETEIQIGLDSTAEGFTEVPWNEFTLRQMANQKFLRNN